MMKTILYATDYSNESVAALKYALGIARALRVRMVLTHVYDVPTVLGTQSAEPFPDLSRDARKHERQRLQEFFEEHIGKVSDETLIRFEPVEHTSVTKGIISKAAEWHAYVIFVGVRGGSKLREIIMGSTTKALIEKAPCPVWAIPENADYAPLKTIVYATAFEEEDVYAIRKLAGMARPFKAKIKIVHISTENEYAGESQMEWFKDLLRQKVTYRRIDFELIFSENIFERIKTYLEEVNADLLVMLERGKKSFFKKWMRGDLVKKMESYGKVPLLSFREGNHQLFYFKAVL
ncbi:universal stress protein [Flagellimonas lutaonensis]|uniref:UspA domain-containing protein n=1 Tax=Flagellimonas lutaonensis TaxID=516051 RepID=A0A0D5YQR9_9FLAO|nr:universal stress protein [Allomuricauda lutaonensis]AKA34238.1 hypothetical protein VC82_565 [Allomuricauda lutaonensis]